jgi:8-oxo-dGTP pyrophosphatase MutT (NUDIX family)
MHKSNNDADLVWEARREETVLKTPIFRVVADHRHQKTLNKNLSFFVLDSWDWVNVIAIDTASVRDPQARVAWVRQFRVGANQNTWEIPGGSCDTANEDPQLAAQRELLEEFHAESKEWIHLGSTSPNPALHRNKVHTFLATGCRVRDGVPVGDGHEVLQTQWFPLTEYGRLIQSGEVHHALVSAAFLFLELALRENRLP